MGLIHTRARKSRDKAEARLLKEQAKAAEAEAAESKPWYLQKTVGGAIRAAAKK